MDSKEQISAASSSVSVSHNNLLVDAKTTQEGEGSEMAMMHSSTSTSAAETTQRKERPPPTVREGLMAIVKSSWLNPMVVFIPIGIASHFVWSPTVTFILNFIAIVPLAKLLGFATEDIALRTGEVPRTKTTAFVADRPSSGLTLLLLISRSSVVFSTPRLATQSNSSFLSFP